MLKYEISKRNKEERNIWSAVAWTDTWQWAHEIATSLEIINGGEFAVFVGGKMIKNLEEAMRC